MIEVARVSRDRWRGYLVRIPSVPTALTRIRNNPPIGCTVIRASPDSIPEKPDRTVMMTASQ